MTPAMYSQGSQELSSPAASKRRSNESASNMAGNPETKWKMMEKNIVINMGPCLIICYIRKHGPIFMNICYICKYGTMFD